MILTATIIGFLTASYLAYLQPLLQSGKPVPQAIQPNRKIAIATYCRAICPETEPVLPICEAITLK